jgi:hypothetical protein
MEKARNKTHSHANRYLFDDGELVVDSDADGLEGACGRVDALALLTALAAAAAAWAADHLFVKPTIGSGRPHAVP